MDFFFNDAVVHRDLYVAVDGHRALLPFPDRQFEDGPSGQQGGGAYHVGLGSAAPAWMS